MKEENIVSELKLNVLGKILLVTLGAWIVGKVVSTKIRGSKTDVETIGNALMASRRFQDELNHPGASVDSVIRKLDLKHMSTSEFERVLGVPWPL